MNFTKRVFEHVARTWPHVTDEYMPSREAFAWGVVVGFCAAVPALVFAAWVLVQVVG